MRIRFSERLKNGRLGEKVVRVANGDNTASSRVEGTGEVWKITIEPDGDADVIITLVAGDNDQCASGLACTTDLRPLSHALSKTVPGPSDSEGDDDGGVVAPPEVPVEEALLPGDGGFVWLGVINGYERGKSRDDELDGTADDRNWYQFVVSGSNGKPSIKANLGLRQLDADADLYLRDRDGYVVAWSRNEGTADEKIDINLAGGPYYLEVRAQEAGANAYELRYGVTALDPEFRSDRSPNDTIQFVPNPYLQSHDGDRTSPPYSGPLLSSLHMPTWESESESRGSNLITLAPGESVSHHFRAWAIDVRGLTLGFASDLDAAINPEDLDLRIVSCDPTRVRYGIRSKPVPGGKSRQTSFVQKCSISLDSNGRVDSDDVLVEFHAQSSLDSRRVLFYADPAPTRLNKAYDYHILFTNRSSAEMTLDVGNDGYVGLMDPDWWAHRMHFMQTCPIQKCSLGIERYNDDGTRMPRRAEHGPKYWWGELKFTLWGA